MKEIYIEKITKELKYESIDGNVFNSKEECMKYEESAKGVLLGKYKKYIIKENISENDLLPCCSEDYKYDIVKVEDADLIKQIYYLFNPKCSGEYVNKQMEKIDLAAKTSDYLLIGRGDDYTCNFWIVGTYTELLKQFSNLFIADEDY
jgi:hypothetical protein